MTIVLDKFEVVACFPIVLFLKYINVLKVLFGHLYNPSLVVQVVGSVSHHYMVKNFNLVELTSQILGELNIANTIAIDTKLDVFLQPLECLWLPLHIDVEPIVTLVQVLAFDVGITILSSYLSIDQGASTEIVDLSFLYQIHNAVRVFVFSFSGKQSITELRHCECVHSFFIYFYSSKVVLWSFVSITELALSFIVTVHLYIVEFCIIQVLID